VESWENISAMPAGTELKRRLLSIKSPSMTQSSSFSSSASGVNIAYDYSVYNWVSPDLANEAIVYTFIFNPLENIQSNGVECAPCL
jgi:hypothetical protein